MKIHVLKVRLCIKAKVSTLNKLLLATYKCLVADYQSSTAIATKLQITFPLHEVCT